MGFQRTFRLVRAEERYPIGAVCGRFQPFHFGHLEYLLEAKKHCNFLYVGITQFNIDQLADSPLDTHRQDPASNPLNYFERHEMITNVLLEAGLDMSQFNVNPFPLDEPRSLKYFLPSTVPIFTTICDEWNISKISMLEELGYKVKVLFTREDKKYNGVTIRHLIREGDDKWKEMLPSASIQAVERYKIRERLKKR